MAIADGAATSAVVEQLREHARAALPLVEGELRVAGLTDRVEVLWDRWGVPHIYARSTPDLYLAQGFVAGSQRLFQIELTLRLGSGRLSEMFGELTLPMDRFVRTVGWNRAAARHLEQWDDVSWEMARSYIAGVRAWIEQMPAAPLEYRILGLEPAVPEGHAAAEMAAAAIVFFAWSLSGNWDAELLRSEIADRLGWEAMLALFPDVTPEPASVVAGKEAGPEARRHGLELLEEMPRFRAGQGSNSWVVAGRRSATGMPLLANDPHLLTQWPPAWLEVHLSAPGIDVRGVSVPFAPGVVLGHNDRIAWGFTNLCGDVQDLYVERLNPEGTSALYEDTWEPLTVHREEIVVRGRAEPVVVEARETRHGPILDAYLIGLGQPEVVTGLRETYALAWVGLEEALRPSILHRMNTAASFEEFRGAVSGWSCPGQNMMYADVDGNIGYQATGFHPIRRRGDGTIPVPGWADGFGWDGYVPFEELPWAYNPDDGFLVTANNRIHDGSYPYLLSRDFLPPFRARRIAAMITERETHDAASFARMQMDTLSLPARALLTSLLEVEPRDERQTEALELLRSWDGDIAAGSAAAAIYEVWCARIAEVILRPVLGEELFTHFHGRRQWTNAFQYQVLPNLLRYPTATWFGAEGREARDDVLLRALSMALEELTSSLGAEMASWEWGALHRVRFAGPLARIPEIGEAFVVAEAPLGGDEQTVLQGMFEPGGDPYEAVIVPSWRLIVDLSDLDRSLGVITVGQSANIASPHLADQFPLWLEGGHHALPFTRAAVEAAIETAQILLP